jgi:hypothetical protein
MDSAMRTQRLAHPNIASSPSPYTDRDGEQSGWGRRVEGTVRLVKPASRFNLIEPEHKLLKPIESTHLRDEPPRGSQVEASSSLATVRSTNTLLPDKSTTNIEPARRPLLLRDSISQPPPSDLPGVSSSLDVAVSPMPITKGVTNVWSPSELRIEARQMFERYGLSPPIS